MSPATTEPRLGPLQLDALREVANIGAGHAATALSQMTSRRIMISIPDLGIRRRAEVRHLTPDATAAVVLVEVQMLGDLTGKTLLIFPLAGAKELAGLLTMRAPGAGELTPLEQSAIQEVGNILASAYLNALSDMIGGVLMPTPPVIEAGAAGVLIDTAALRGPGSDPVLAINTHFIMDDADIEGTFVVLPTHESLERILQALRV